MEAINLFLDLPGVCFYLGLDWERLVARLPEAVRAEGDEFLEKIVQVSLELPAVSATGAEGRGTSRVLRGGSFVGLPRALRGAFRNYNHPELRVAYVGSRVVWSSSGGLD